MLRLSFRVCGSYLLNQRVIADWWQPRFRERMHNAAKAKLSLVLQECTNEGRSSSPPVEADAAFADTLNVDGTSSPPPPLSLYDANALVATFVSNHNTEDLSGTLQYIREHLGQELTPFHFHALLRNFNYHQDMNNALQLLEVMVQSGTMTLETYARMADCIHALSTPDAQTRILQLVTLAQEAFGTQVMSEGVESEGAVTAMYSNNEEGRRARETDGTAKKPNFQTLSAPLLSSLLHHLSSVQHVDAVASCLLVALWIRALGVELSDWDVLAVLSSVVVHPNQFPRLCMLFGHFEGHERGHVSVQAVLERLSLLGEVNLQRTSTETEKSSSSNSRNAGASSSAHSHFTQLIDAMRRSLNAAGGDRVMTAAVSLPFMNAQTNDVDDFVLNTLRPLMQDGVGAHRYNAGHLLHALSLVNSAARDDVGAMQMLMCGIREEARQEQQQEGPDTGVLLDVGDAATPCTTKTTTNANARSDGGPASEPFSVPVHHLIDMGTILNRMSTCTLREVQKPFRGAIRRLVGALSSDRSDQSGDDVPDSQATFTPSCSAPIATARDLVRLSHYETQFLRTTAEAREVLRQAIDSGNAAGSSGRLPRHTQLMFLQLAEFCCRHPPRNPKLTPAGLEERAKWARYLDARDTSLALFGSARQSRDSMKHLFYHDNRLPALRSDAVIAKDFADVHRIFFGPTIPQPSSPVSSQAELQQALLRTRTTLPHTGSNAASVPRYLWDPAVYNPYPAAQLANNSAEYRSRDGSIRGAFTAAEIHQFDTTLGGVVGSEDDMKDTSEFFVELWHALLDKTTSVGSNSVWYLQNTGMYLLLVRCLLHRLDWEAAVHLTRKMTQHATYNYMMDHELTMIFREIGDPAGCLAFKVATKLFDGRITKDGQTKRDQLQQEQFN